ncbi:MAG TPA: type II toxin-antitoxin system VapC family toxin [Dehalococcoidia bacterium]|nr:type II toxin-antitoxin system VapC family toxin [Dehalococcoidia bacterium]
MILYLDTSSLLKLYVEEPGSAEVEASAREAAGVASSLVAYAEARAALARAHRDRRLTTRAYRAVVRAFEDQWPSYTAVAVAESIVRLAGTLAERHALRGFDAIHLASALALRDNLQEPVAFSASDGALMAAAGLEGLATAPATP